MNCKQVLQIQHQQQVVSIVSSQNVLTVICNWSTTTNHPNTRLGFVSVYLSSAQYVYTNHFLVDHSITNESLLQNCFCFKFYLMKIWHILYTKINKSIKVQIKVVKQIGRMSAWFVKVWRERLVSLQCTALHHHHFKQRVWDVYHLSCTLQLPPSLSCTSCITTAVMMQ